jgi:hypothetical protein
MLRAPQVGCDMPVGLPLVDSKARDIGMSVTRPYRRTCRQFVDGGYIEGGRAGYMRHPKFAQSPEHYVRAFLILLKDLQELFDYVEPADKNLDCYSSNSRPIAPGVCRD